MKRSLSTCLLSIPLFLSLQSCGGDFDFGDVTPGLYRLSYERSAPVSRLSITGEIMIEVQEDGDVNFSIYDVIEGGATGSGTIDPGGDFTLTTGGLPRGDGLNVTIEGGINGTGKGATVDATVSGDITANVEGGYHSDGAENPYNSDYDGTFVGDFTQPFDMDVFTDGHVTGSFIDAQKDIWTATGTVNNVGYGTIVFTPSPTAGRGLAEQITMTGFFTLPNGWPRANGTYTGFVGSGSVGGDWSAFYD